MHIFRNFHLDNISFWLGILVGALAFLIGSRLLPIFKRILGHFFKPIQSQLQLRGGTTEFHYRNDLLKQSQRQHLVQQLLPLDDLLIPPKLLVPPPLYEPGVWSPLEDITSTTIPYLLDWSELSSAYNTRTCSLAEALYNNANIILVGQPGSGKTVAMADFISQVVRKTPEVKAFHDHLLLSMHICDLCPFEKTIEKPLEKIIEVTTQKSSRQIQKRLPKWINFKISEGKAIFLLDGLDELPQKYFDQAVNLISALINENPKIQIVVTASPEYTGNLNRLGFIPISISCWSKADKFNFIEKWEKAWTKLIHETNQDYDIDTALINSWFFLDQLDESPLELTLKLWAAYAGDVLGVSPGSEIYAHLMRLSKKDKLVLQAMGQLALQMVTTEEPFLNQKSIESWVNDWNKSTRQMIFSSHMEDSRGKEDFTVSTKAVKEIQNLIDDNIARDCFDNCVFFNHPSFTSYLAANAIFSLSRSINVLDLPEWKKQIRWSTRSQTFKYLTYYPHMEATINSYFQSDDSLIHMDLLKIARWIKNVPNTSPWYGKIMRALVGIVQREENALSLRARAILALLSTGDSGVAPFIKGMLNSEKASFRQLAALGCGLIQDTTAVENLTRLLSDPAPTVHRAACLALINIGSRAAIDAVAYLLLNGNEQQRQAAAEAIANHPIESVGILQEGSEMNDLQVRRAVVFGLKRIGKRWAFDILKKMSVDEKEWVVKDAALHAVESLSQENTTGIFPLKPPSETPWLLAFAGERGIGISPGKSANDLILMALKEGNEEQKLAALSYIKTKCEPIGIPQILNIFHNSHGELKESAFNTLWYLYLAGIEIPVETPIA